MDSDVLFYEGLAILMYLVVPVVAVLCRSPEL